MEGTSNQFDFATGSDTHLRYRRLLGTGGSGSVHELYHVVSQRALARKILHIPGVTMEAVEHEVQVLKKLCGQNTHINIIQVLNDGLLPGLPYYFIDMELCELSLKDYIHRATLSEPSDSLPYFVRDAGVDVTVLQIWNIMRQIASGIEYIHCQGHVHRDIKPANILYSRKDSVWKIGDFGLTSEASSTRITKESRGTPGYRAPELVNLDSTAGFSSKSDIFSLGCILYELATCKPAFVSDGAVHAYRLERKDKDVELDDFFDAESKRIITMHIVAMLQIVPSVRPRAPTLVEEFSRYCERLPSPVVIENPRPIQIRPLVDIVEETVRVDVDEVKEVLESDGYKGVERLYLKRTELLQESDPEGLYDNFQGWWSKTSHLLVFEAVSNGDVKLLQELRDADVDITAPRTAERQTTLHLASIAGHAEVVEMLLNVKARVELKTRIATKDSRAWNPLHEAAFRGFTEIVGLLLEADAIVVRRSSAATSPFNVSIIESRNESGATAFFLAASEGHEETVKRLLSAKANVAHRDCEGNTMLQTASRYGYEGIVKLLLDAGADVRCQDQAGQSALHHAARGGHIEIVKILLDAKANANMEDNLGKVAWQLANRRDVAVLLQDYAAPELRRPTTTTLRRLFQARSNSRKE